MDIKIIIDKNYTTPKVVVYTNQVSEDVSQMLELLNRNNNSQLYGFIGDSLYFLNFNDIFSIYSSNGKVYANTDDKTYLLKYRLYQLETILGNNFVRISNSEIANINKIKNLDFSTLGTIRINFINNTFTYVSRRYIKKIKDYLNL